jgi:hypothetical protein
MAPARPRKSALAELYARETSCMWGATAQRDISLILPSVKWRKFSAKRRKPVLQENYNDDAGRRISISPPRNSRCKFGIQFRIVRAGAHDVLHRADAKSPDYCTGRELIPQRFRGRGAFRHNRVIRQCGGCNGGFPFATPARTEHLLESSVGRCTMTANPGLHAVGETPASRKVESHPPALPGAIGTGLAILAFGAVWFVFLRGLTALGRMLMIWHF